MSGWTNTNPNLIEHIDLQEFIVQNTKNATVSEKISLFINNIYNDYIKDNIIVIIVILAFAYFLYYRYTAKKAEQFNPLYSIESQQEDEPVQYPADPLPINLPDKGTVLTRNIYPDPPKYTPVNNDEEYDYNNVYTNPSRSYYTGTHNTYLNARDTDIENPLSFPNNFNETDGNYVGFATDRNAQNIVDYQSILDDTNKNLIQSLRLGPKHLKASEPEYEMDPPYA